MKVRYGTYAWKTHGLLKSTGNLTGEVGRQICRKVTDSSFKSKDRKKI